MKLMVSKTYLCRDGNLQPCTFACMYVPKYVNGLGVDISRVCRVNCDRIGASVHEWYAHLHELHGLSI